MMAKIGEKKDLSETFWHTGTSIAVSDIILVGYSAKTDLFAFKTVCSGDYHHSNWRAETLRYLAFPHVNNYSSLKLTWHKTIIKQCKRWPDKAD